MTIIPMTPEEVADKAISLVEALKTIARGRVDCGRPLAAEVARCAAREALVAADITWDWRDA